MKTKETAILLYQHFLFGFIEHIPLSHKSRNFEKGNNIIVVHFFSSNYNSCWFTNRKYWSLHRNPKSAQWKLSAFSFFREMRWECHLSGLNLGPLPSACVDSLRGLPASWSKPRWPDINIGYTPNIVNLIIKMAMNRGSGASSRKLDCTNKII